VRAVGGEDWDGNAAGDAAFAMRVKALACTAPLHDLDVRKSSIQIGDYAVYQMSELALQAIDLVTIAMDFDTGARPSKVIADLSAIAATHAPDRAGIEHEAVARWVLENLLNVGTADRGFRTIYGIDTAQGYDRRSFDFKLLEETLGGDGELYLRASNEAVNVLVGALEVDIESAQIAAHLRLDVLIKRGRLTDAQAAAQAARYQTIRYAEMLRQRLEATNRDVRNVDWLTTMPQFLNDALTHIEERYHTENAILVNITDARDTADTPVRKQQAAALVVVIRDCLRRHSQLQSAIQTAGHRFRFEQDRQSFTHAPTSNSLDLHAQLLAPVLALSIAVAERPLHSFWARSAGQAVPSALRLADLFDGLITPVAERDLLGDQIFAPDLADDEEPQRFSDATYDQLHQLLDLDPDAPQRLSGLLADARIAQAADEDVAELPLLLVVRVLAWAAQEIASARHHGERSVMIAVDDGTPLEDREFGGSDLLIARAELLDDARAAAHVTADIHVVSDLDEGAA
jgi:hypothetical protein